MCSKIVCACLDALVDIIPINAHNKKNNENKLKVDHMKDKLQIFGGLPERFITRLLEMYATMKKSLNVSVWLNA